MIGTGAVHFVVCTVYVRSTYRANSPTKRIFASVRPGLGGRVASQCMIGESMFLVEEEVGLLLKGHSRDGREETLGEWGDKRMSMHSWGKGWCCTRLPKGGFPYLSRRSYWPEHMMASPCPPIRTLQKEFSFTTLPHFSSGLQKQVHRLTHGQKQFDLYEAYSNI